MEFLGIDLIDQKDFLKLIIRASFNLLIIGGIVLGLYYPSNKNKNYVFTYLLIAVVVFFLCFLLENVKLELSFALGLFAIFGIIRYRTETIPIKEMTYLFVVIGVAVINALANKKVSYVELLFANSAIIFVVNYFENISPRIKPEKKETVSVTLQKFNEFSSLPPNEKTTHLEQLVSKTITHFKIKKINQPENSAELIIYTQPL